MPETNPYSPPRSRPPARDSQIISGPIRMALRAVAVIWGFSLLAAPAQPAPNTSVHEGQLFAKTFGAILIVAAFFPFGEQRRTRSRDVRPEDL